MTRVEKTDLTVRDWALNHLGGVRFVEPLPACRSWHRLAYYRAIGLEPAFMSREPDTDFNLEQLAEICGLANQDSCPIGEHQPHIGNFSVSIITRATKSWSYGQVTNFEVFPSAKDGLYSLKIFGPEVSGQCSCDKREDRLRAVLRDVTGKDFFKDRPVVPGTICEKCGVSKGS